MQAPSPKQALMLEAAAFDQEQAQRAKEFNAQVDRAFGRKVHERDPVTWAWLRARMAPLLHEVVLPGRIMPWMLFGADYANHPGYVPIARRIELTSHRFNEIYSQGVKTPRRDMIAVT